MTTPGFNSRITITFAADKNGKKRAFYLAQFRSMTTGEFRRFPMPLAQAEVLVAQGLADVA